MSVRNARRSRLGREAEEGERVLADVRVDEERDAPVVVVRRAADGAERHDELVADAVDVEDDAIRFLVNDAPRESSDHR